MADRVAIMRKGRLMHVEDMHERRTNLRLVLLRLCENRSLVETDGLEISVRNRNGANVLIEHRGTAQELLGWLSKQEVEDVAVGTDDLKSLYDKYHGANARSDFDDDVLSAKGKFGDIL